MTTATKTYEGTKRVHARPMNRGEYNAYRGWEVPADENPADDGYLVEYLDGGKPNHPGHAGYISWSPKDVFERSYKELPASPTSAAATPVDDAIEAEIQAKGKTAPRVTPADIEANIASEHYFTASEGVIGAFVAGKFGARGGDAVTVLRDMASPEALKPSLNLLTFCVLVLRNGFTVTGESACASPENFDAEIGRNIARQNAVQKIWPLMGYELRTKLCSGV